MPYKCQLCLKKAWSYVYALGVNPLDASANFCGDHVEDGRAWADQGFGTRVVLLTHDGLGRAQVV